MFTLKLYDRKGIELGIGDIVEISDGKTFTFYAEVKYLEKEKVITPFHTFSFHSFEKVDKVPEFAIKSTEERYNIWYVQNDDRIEDKGAGEAERYLMDWRCCEHLQDLIVDCIKAGCPENGIVLDPFIGAGTTALVTAKLQRNFIGFELNPAYIKIANKRLKKELGMFHPDNIENKTA
jgi:hypothetical protein